MLEPLLTSKEIAVFCGSGGVGKTTMAAASAAMVAARVEGRVLVVTIDPARRLANALGLAEFGNVETRIEDAAFKEAGVTPRGELWAAMLDTKESWDNLVRRHAPDADTAQTILQNPLYQNVAGRFVQSHDYIAMERLFELHSEGSYDLIVVDTPPTRHAIDFLEAPERMAEFFSSRFLRLLTAPARSRVVNLATRPFYTVADRILGTQFLEDIAEFFILFQTMYDGFVERARAVERLLRDWRTTFAVVTTLEPAPAHETRFFVDALRERQLHLGAVVLNKVLPAYLLDPEAERAAERLEATANEVGAALERLAEGSANRRLAPLAERIQVERVLVEVAESFRRFHVVAQREAEERAELGSSRHVVASVPYLDRDVTDIARLLEVGEALWT